MVLRKVPEDDLCILAYHDAAWGNVLPDDQEDHDASWLGEHTTASQLAHLILFASKSCLTSAGGNKFSVVDWRSKASHRVRDHGRM